MDYGSFVDDAVGVIRTSGRVDPVAFHEQLRLAMRSYGIDYVEMLDGIALVVAERYLDLALSYTDGDDIMNSMWAFMVDEAPDRAFPTFAVDVYEAFDEGEYHHGDGLDPVMTYTVPRLEELVRSSPPA